MSQDYYEGIRNEFLNLLQNTPLTTQQLIVKTGVPNSTAYKIVKELEREGMIQKYDNKSRNHKWTIGVGSNAHKSIIPSITYKGDVGKVTSLSNVEGMSNYAKQIMEDILVCNLRILDTAERINMGLPVTEAGVVLRDIKADLLKALDEMEQLMFIGRQILNLNKMWRLENLDKFPYDDSWLPSKEARQKALQKWYEERNVPQS